MDEDYKDLRRAIYGNDEEFRRFRQLMINVVIATDIADKDLKVLRNNRWAKAFSEDDDSQCKDSPRDAINRKATIVIEHLIQASDVAHTMQHWHVYRKWNERFFMECYKAYKQGRAETDPSTSWYKGEIGFFDFYIVSLFV
jgi:3'5'-cyclic nucleotide phosphodiesterase